MLRRGEQEIGKRLFVKGNYITGPANVRLGEHAPRSWDSQRFFAIGRPRLPHRMVRHKRYDYVQPVRFQQQILPGTFEYMLNKLIDEHFDLSVSNGQ